MFGSSGAKPKNKNTRDLSQFGLMNIPDFESGTGIADDDFGLEAELNALMGGGNSSRPKKKSGKKVVKPEELDAMVNACMKDIEDFDDINDYDDPDLLNELEGMMSDENDDDFPPPSSSDEVYASSNLLSVINTRIDMYNSAIQNAQRNHDESKARRFNRGLATLKTMKKAIENNKSVNENDMPPPIANHLIINTTTTTSQNSTTIPSLTPINEPENTQIPPPPATYKNPPPPPPAQKVIKPMEPSNSAPKDAPNDVIRQLRSKRDSVKAIALKAKSDGDKARAVEAIRAIKIIDTMITSAEAGDPIDLANLPEITNKPPAPPAPPKLDRSFSRDDPIQLPENIEDIPAPDPEMFGAPPLPKTILEALNQRLEKYQSDEAKAKTDGNASKARRLGRICKQYTDAIKANKAGKPIAVNDLPTPLGFPPIPVSDKTPIASPMTPKTTPNQPAAGPSETSSKSMKVVSSSKKPMSIQEKQLDLLQKRQLMFKQAALEAKKSGQIEQAKEYLRQAKGFDKLIDASHGGLPVDINTLPVPPQMQRDDVALGFEIVRKENCVPMGKNRQDMFSKLEGELLEQIKMCRANKSHFKSTGDIPSANTFHQMEEHSKKDLDALRNAFSRNDPVPKFHYEIRSFSRVQCNVDLSDMECEINIMAGVNYMGSKEIDTYVRYEFPYPKEAPYKDKTETIKDSINPSYNHTVLLPCNVKERSCQRVFKRQSLKCEVMSKGGFLRSDNVLGTVNVKLQPLETHCTLHDSFPLMDGRKAVGGKLEVKIRLRNPILTKQIEKVEEKWLVIVF